MLFNRHFIIIVFSISFIGMIFWWQKPDTAVSAMARAEYNSNPYSIVKNYWKRLDYRQFELALEMTEVKASRDHAKIERLLTENPLLSIQKTIIQVTPEENTFMVKTTFGSLVNEKQEINYLVRVEQTKKGWLISSIEAIP